MLLLACGIVAVGALLQGSVGFGMALVSAPFLLLLEPKLVPGPLLCAALLLTSLVAAREHRHMDKFKVLWALGGRLPGTVLGAVALAMIEPRAMSIFLAAVILIAVAMSGSGLRIEPRRLTLVLVGIVSGIMGTTSSIGGPPVAMVFQHSGGPTLRGTLAGYFVCSATMSLIAVVAVGHFDRQQLTWAAALLPGVVVGFSLSARTAKVLDKGYTRPAVLATSAVGAVAVILRQVL